MILDLLAGAAVNETVHWVVLKMRDKRGYGSDPYKKALNKIIQDLETKKFKKEICVCVKNTVLNVNINHTHFEEMKDISNVIFEKSLSEFKKDYRSPTEEEKTKIEEACKYLCNEFEREFTYIIEDPTYTLYKILTSISIPSIEIYLDKKQRFTKEKDTLKKIFFKQEPDWTDFEKRLFVKRKEKNTVLSALKKDGIHVVFGDPSAGKSHFVRWLGYLLSEDYNVFFIDLKREDIEMYIDDIKKLANDITSILIVDNAHLSVKSVESVIGIAEGKNIKLLISTRDVEKSHPESNLKKYIRTYSTKIESADIATQMVDLYSKIENVHIPFKEKKALLSTYGRDLWFLKWALETFEEKETLSEESIYKRIAEKRFYTYSYDIEEKVENVGEIFYYISLFSQYEFPVEKEFIAHKTDRDNLEKLIKSREFIVEKRNIMLHHSSIADIYLDALYYGVYRGLDLEKIEKVFADYFKMCPRRGVTLFGILGSRQYEAYELIKKLVSEIGIGNVGKVIDRSNDVHGIGWCVYSILKADSEVGKSLLGNVGKVIDRSNDVHGIGWCVSSILRIDPDAGKSLVSQISLPALAENIDHSDDLHGIGECVFSILGADPDAGKSLVSQISLPTLAENIDHSDGVMGIEICVFFILEADPDAGRKLISLIERKDRINALMKTIRKTKRGLLMN